MTMLQLMSDIWNLQPNISEFSKYCLLFKNAHYNQISTVCLLFTNMCISLFGALCGTDNLLKFYTVAFYNVRCFATDILELTNNLFIFMLC